MKLEKNRLLFFIGTGLLIVAVLELTILPYVLNMHFPALYIPVERHKTAVGYIYMASFMTYMFSLGYYKKQVAVILIAALYYVLFQLIVANIHLF